jgi:hypothetical protein
VWVYSGGGSDGLKPKREAAARGAQCTVPTLIGHLADYDEDGGDFQRTPLPQDALAFAKWHLEYQGAPGRLHIVRLGLTRPAA